MKKLTVKNYLTKEDMRYVDYQEFIDLCEGDLSGMDDNFINNRILKIFYGINTSDARLLQLEQIEILLAKCHTVIALPPVPFRNIIIMGGKQYGFFNFSKATAGELIDMDDCLTRNDIVSLTSIVYREIDGKINKNGEYNVVPYTGYDNKFHSVGVDIVEGYLGFFYQSYQQLSQDTHTSIQ